MSRSAVAWALGAAVVVAGMVLLPSQLYTGQVRVVTAVLMFVALAQAWNIIGGFTGYACFGQVAFFGIGGYATAVLMEHANWSFWAALPVSALGCAATTSPSPRSAWPKGCARWSPTWVGSPAAALASPCRRWVGVVPRGSATTGFTCCSSRWLGWLWGWPR
jgi:hypothetical protein